MINKIKSEKVRTISFDRSTANQIFTYLRDEIVSMDLLPGETIPETKLAAQFGVSRTPVREALSKLSDLGFVEVRPQRGTFVSKLSMEKILEARFIRESLEVAVAAALAENVTDDIIVSCEDIIRQQEVAAKEHDAPNFQILDDKFHQTLANHTGFSRVALVVEAEKSHMDRVRNLSLKELTGQYEHIIAQHKAILAAIKSGSPEKAKHAMSIHMKDVFNILKVAPQQHPEYFTDT